MAEAALLLLAARLLVRHVPLGIWRASLGSSPDGDRTGRSGHAVKAQRLAGSVERAAAHLPGTSKCLPRAMALQWMLRRRGLPSRLVVALAVEGGVDAHHAWTESGGEMLLGACDRASYRPLMILAQGEAAPTSGRT